MKIQRLYIGDFGILRNQSLDDINPGMVVIGGHNRAGKSTLMQILRYLGYGFPKGRDLPPATNNYEAEADIKMAAGDTYNLRLRGYGQPSVGRLSGSQGEVITADELYGIDNYTYGQLFTISLDELTGTSGKSSDEIRKLQSVLLGAGFRDMLLIPQLEEEFRSEGEKIGGKRGNPSVKQFKPYYQKIETGRKKKQKGLAQVGKYRDTEEELRLTKKTISRVRIEVEDLQDRITRLDLVKNNYDTYIRMEELREILFNRKDDKWEGHPLPHDIERLEELKDSLDECRTKLRYRELEVGIGEDRRAILIGQKEELSRYRAGISGIGERCRHYNHGISDYEKKKRKIESDIRELRGPWGDKDFESISRIRTDQIKQHNLDEMVEAHRNFEREYENKVDNLKIKKEQYGILEKNLKAEKDNRPHKGAKKYFYSSLAFTIIGIILLFINSLAGIIIGVGGALGVAIHLILSSEDSRDAQRALVGARGNLKTLEAEIIADERSLAMLKKRIDSMEDNLGEMALDMGLPMDVSYGLLPGYLERLRNIQKRIEELEDLHQELKGERAHLNRTYTDYSEFIGRLGGKVYKNDGPNTGHRPEDWQGVDVELKKLEGYLEGALDIRSLDKNVKDLEGMIEAIILKYEPLDHYKGGDEEIREFMDKGTRAIEYSLLEEELEKANQSILNIMKSDAIRRAFGLEDLKTENLSETKDPISAFYRACSVYSSEDEVNSEYERLKRERDENLENLEELKKARQRLENDLEALKAMDNLMEGQRQIDGGRADLKILGDAYALNMAAAFLLKEAKRNLLDGMKGSLMDSAGNIFNKMTGGQYEGIQPSEKILDSDFEAVPEGDMVPQTVDMLSRGTKEQLYLSVRLSRIMDINPCLPVIIDDSLANFDSMHLGQSLDILWELSKTHQIFILTCHGNLVEEIANYDGGAQYWKLDRGKITLSEDQELMEYLS